MSYPRHDMHCEHAPLLDEAAALAAASDASRPLGVFT